MTGTIAWVVGTGAVLAVLIIACTVGIGLYLGNKKPPQSEDREGSRPPTP